MAAEPLPNAEQAIVGRRKLLDYLLSEAHPDGRGKARFFLAHGFTVSDSNVLAAALRQHARTHEVVERMESEYGVRYGVEGELSSPDSRAPGVRAVWFVAHGSDVPELVTAYPLKRRSSR